MVYVNLKKEERLNIIKKLKKNGFRENEKEKEIIDSPFPFIVDFDKKTYSCLKSSTQASLLTVNKNIMKRDSFFEMIKKLEK